MSIPSYDPINTFTGAGNQSAYTFDFKITDLDDILIVADDNLGAEVFRGRGTDVGAFLNSVVLNDDGTGTVNLVANLTTNYKLFLFLAVDSPVQLSVFKNKGDLKLTYLEKAFDYLLGPIQRLTWLVNRTIHFKDTVDVSAVDLSIPAPTPSSILVSAADGLSMTWAALSMATGPAGPAGPAGPTGATGATGATGPTGAAGTNGTNGTNGATGATGAKGDKGVDGIDGTDGAAGPGVAIGGTAGQVLVKNSGTDYDTSWETLAMSQESTFVLANNQAAPANITGMSFGFFLSRFVKITYLVQRVTTGIGATELIESGELLISFNPTSNNYTLVQGMSTIDSGVVFSVTAAGQVQYTSSNITGSASVSKINWLATKIIG